MRLRDGRILQYLKGLQQQHQISRPTFFVILRYIACHQLATLFDESISFLCRCKSQHVYPKFIDSLFFSIPHQRNTAVRIQIEALKSAVLSACIAERRKRKGHCIREIVMAKELLKRSLSRDLWKAVSLRNRQVCAELRVSERASLKTKFSHLVPSIRPPPFINANTIPPKRCTVIGTNIVDADMLSTLNLGPSFSVSQPVTQNTIDAVLCSVQKFAHELRWRHHREPTVLDRSTTLMSSMPFPKSNISVPKPVPPLEPKITALQLNLLRIYNTASKAHVSNMTVAEARGLRKLIRVKDQLRYTVGDKCGGFVVMPKVMDKELTRMALSDATVYEETTRRTFDSLSQQLRTTIRSILFSKMGVKGVARLVVNSPVVPTYYSLTKTHKIGINADLERISVNDIKTRPIISCCGGPTDRISWLLVKLLSPLLKYVGAHIVNVEDFIAAVEGCQMPNSASYVSFDAVSLYTNVDKECATKAVLELLQEHHADVNVLGLTMSELEQLLLATLACNVFRFDNRFYVQKRGLAMGLRLAPLLAIAYLDRIGKNVAHSRYHPLQKVHR
ncbi:hypothetical protein Y032_0277g1105 [Ancylostoma ceylanicum]|uniref:Reverse transcriptase domain-containing protein n=2 Tax=Ancylostoma ceylanicum TaxID=53326 RepID=A0A016S8D1_9BILA|nr:hypothetical protein Y032_0277g1105 [Ancylostoma ceylanicum]